MLAGRLAPSGAKERPELLLALSAAPAADGVHGHEAALEDLLEVHREAALGGRDDVDAPDLQPRAAHAEGEPQVLGDQRPPRLSEVEVAAGVERMQRGARQ